MLRLTLFVVVRILFVEFRHDDTRFSIPNFERSALDCIDAELYDQVLVGDLDEIYKFHILLATLIFKIL